MKKEKYHTEYTIGYYGDGYPHGFYNHLNNYINYSYKGIRKGFGLL
jgi:hypothetical protein